MMQTFTPPSEKNTIQHRDEEEKPSTSEGTEPSLKVLRNILNYSRNLEVLPSEMISSIQLLKS
jgi:hypothetical protein